MLLDIKRMEKLKYWVGYIILGDSDSLNMNFLRFWIWGFKFNVCIDKCRFVF